jgi:hypothetical protein
MPSAQSLISPRVESCAGFYDAEVDRLFRMRAEIIDYLITVKTADRFEKNAMAKVFATGEGGLEGLAGLAGRLLIVSALPEIKPACGR